MQTRWKMTLSYSALTGVRLPLHLPGFYRHCYRRLIEGYISIGTQVTQALLAGRPDSLFSSSNLRSESWLSQIFVSLNTSIRALQHY